MAGLLIITWSGESTGFRLAGFDCVETDEEGVDPVIDEIVKEGKYGLVCVEGRLLSKVSESLMRRIRKKGFPAVIPIETPQKWGMEEGEPRIVKLIRKAVGYQIKIRK